jgi:SPW repeat
MEVAMASFALPKEHRTWEDWVGIGLALAIQLTVFVGSTPNVDPGVLMNTTLVAVVVMALAAMEIVAVERWEEIAEVGCGLWLMASPFTLGYTNDGRLTALHLVLGALVVLLAAVELWQDRNLARENPMI